MFVQIKLGGVWSLLICLAMLQWGAYATTNISALNAVFIKKLTSTSLEKLLNYDNLLPSSLNSSCFSAKDNVSIIELCLADQCLSAEVIADLYGLSPDAALDQQTVRQVAPALLYTLTQRSSCLLPAPSNMTSSPTPAMGAWGYGFLFVTLINLCSLTGIIVLPFMKTAIYKVILMFLVALAVGTLVGSGVLVLIPEAFGLTHLGGGGGEEGEESDDSYIWTSTSIIGGIYLFFIIERVLRVINMWRENTKEKKQQDEFATRGTLTSSFTRKTPTMANQDLKNPAKIQLVESPSAHCLCHMDVQQQAPDSSSSAQPSPGKLSRSSCSQEEEGKRSGGGGGGVEGGEGEGGGGVVGENGCVALEGDGELLTLQRDDSTGKALLKKTQKEKLMNGHGHSHGHGEGSPVAPVAYMVIFGDGLHNFIDGLSIGAAFTDSILLGISVSVAVICEELPHELGDFAILLNAGMRVRRALMYNFLSSLMCYAGLVLGILVGENTTAHTWIFGVAGGMFLYIALVDMMPEMNSASESKEGRQFGVLKTFLLQNLGLLCGYAIILFMSLYGDTIILH